MLLIGVLTNSICRVMLPLFFGPITCHSLSDSCSVVWESNLLTARSLLTNFINCWLWKAVVKLNENVIGLPRAFHRSVRLISILETPLRLLGDLPPGKSRCVPRSIFCKSRRARMASRSQLWCLDPFSGFYHCVGSLADRLVSVGILWRSDTCRKEYLLWMIRHWFKPKWQVMT